MNENEKSVLDYIIALLNPQLLQTASLSVKQNEGVSTLYNSIVIYPENNPYRNGLKKEVLFARIRASGKQPYISFNIRNEQFLQMFSNNLCSIKSDPDFMRIALKAFMEYPDLESLSKALNTVFLNAFNYPTFGCCSLYKECSQAGRCLHSDIIYANACMYRKNLEMGKVFY